ncbi:probable dolichyl pyrophosphate Glc1Man9GlcNAc2 alpha-1,3-glucosyltransferase isoform X2 [Rhodamnia argentea]|uniref:Alpha-1,3-glucosyltransferase n=1 Tax=Rhodamnia argentea TaxID=178133 RepID=A0ABM3H7U6_9MYRT|nr:probable dolichyl pyrophosphate Glc1Man9GlcNAc2 alpha-1,3-glucosyltransferase isoform X2 [Rhodamnia argentea]
MTNTPPPPVSELRWHVAVATCLKLLLIPSYRSTDFEVHRHWLALTHSLPLSRWYTDETSPWTLDYPPFFAFFELLLSYAARAVDPVIVHLHRGLNCRSDSVVLFQRITVIAADSCLFYAVYRLTRKCEPRKGRLIWALVIWSPMLLIVDHVHFQYNGFLLGILLLSISYLSEGKDLAGGCLFAILLCFKHLFAVAAPVYFVYLLRRCFRGTFVRGFGRLSALGVAVIAIFAAAYGPFIYHGQMQQVIRRMFPFGRGLCHAYWAPNMWVFYIVMDKVLSFVLRRLGFDIQMPAASFTGGLVGNSSPFAVLPQAWRNPQPKDAARWIAYAYTSGFLFGWHVHEKASLHFVIPLALTAVQSLGDAKHYFWLSIVSCYSLFPLLYEAQEYPIKVLLLLLHCMAMFLGFSALFNESARAKATAPESRKGDQSGEKRSSSLAKGGGFTIGWITRCYLFGILLVELWGQFLHPYILGNKLPFVPLMMISVYCAFGIMYSWIWQLRSIVRCSS